MAARRFSKLTLRRLMSLRSGRRQRPSRLASEKCDELPPPRRGWTEGRNGRIDLRGSNGDAVTSRKAAAQLVARKPDVILAMGSLSVTAL